MAGWPETDTPGLTCFNLHTINTTKSYYKTTTEKKTTHHSTNPIKPEIYSEEDIHVQCMSIY